MTPQELQRRIEEVGRRGAVLASRNLSRAERPAIARKRYALWRLKVAGKLLRPLSPMERRRILAQLRRAQPRFTATLLARQPVARQREILVKDTAVRLVDVGTDPHYVKKVKQRKKTLRSKGLSAGAELTYRVAHEIHKSVRRALR